MYSFFLNCDIDKKEDVLMQNRFKRTSSLSTDLS